MLLNLMIGLVVAAVLLFVFCVLHENKLVRQSFFLGTLFSIALYGIVQDTLGLEGYIAYLQAYWMKPNALTWILYVGCVLVTLLSARALGKRYTVKKV